MSDTTLAMTASQLSRLRELTMFDKKEAAAIALCGRSKVSNPWTGGFDERFLIHEIVPIDLANYISRSVSDFELSTTPFFNALRLAERKNLAIAFVHSHPGNDSSFSPHDDASDDELYRLAFSRLESRSRHLSIVLARGGRISARAIDERLNKVDIQRITILGDRWEFRGRVGHEPGDEFDRQTRAFGADLSRALSSLRIAVVGCGGTGSAVAHLLARIGVREIGLIDPDVVERTNLSRVYFSTQTDASLSRPKVNVVGQGIANLGLPTSVKMICSNVAFDPAIDLLKSCDVVFGCTDDNLGRVILNRISHFYMIPVIDMGLLIEPIDDGFGCFDGRVTVLQPGHVCSSCRGLIDGEQLHREALELDERLLRERRQAGYVANRPEPSPVVVTFTTEVACMATNELMHRLIGFRGSAENCSERVRHFPYLKDSDTIPGGKPVDGCKLCNGRYVGRGDMTPSLDLVR
jgi:molybdopterin/thiamine biosynthesis adenylyltransferase